MNYFLSLVVLSTFCCASGLHLEKFESLSAHYKPGAAVERIANGHSHEVTRPETYSYNPAVNQCHKALTDKAWNKGYMFTLSMHYIIGENANSGIRFNDHGDLISFTDGYNRALAVGDYPGWLHDLRSLASRTDQPYVLSFAIETDARTALDYYKEQGLIDGNNMGGRSNNPDDFFPLMVNYIGIVRPIDNFGFNYIAVNYNHSAFESLTSSVGWVFGIERKFSTEDAGMALSAIVAYIAQILHESGHSFTIDTIVAYLKRCGVQIKAGDIKYDLIERYIQNFIIHGECFTVLK